MEEVRKDSLSMVQLTSSPFVVDIYGYCGQSQLVEYGANGSLHDLVKLARVTGQDYISSRDKLRICYHIAKAVADAHNSDIVHNDISVNQFIPIDGIYKLNDFDPRFLQWHVSNNTMCQNRLDTYWRVSGAKTVAAPYFSLLCF